MTRMAVNGIIMDGSTMRYKMRIELDGKSKEEAEALFAQLFSNVGIKLFLEEAE